MVNLMQFQDKMAQLFPPKRSAHKKTYLAYSGTPDSGTTAGAGDGELSSPGSFTIG